MGEFEGWVVLPVSLKEIGVSRGLPPDGRVDAVVGDVVAVVTQLQRVALLQVGLPEEPESVFWRDDKRGWIDPLQSRWEVAVM